MRNEFVGIKFRAFALAMKAKSGNLDTDDIQEVRILWRAAQDELSPRHPFRADLRDFVTQIIADRFNVELHQQLGSALMRAIDADNMPVPPDMDRSDIHG